MDREIKGNNLAGHSGYRGRVERDYYATPPEATVALLEVEELQGKIWEPACGGGHISEVLREKGLDVISTDLIDRGYKYMQGKVDFLESECLGDTDIIITNPPFKYMLEFAQKGIEVASQKVILFGKIQFLEGKSRQVFFKNSPLKYVYVFSRRINPWRNGNPLDENGKAWCSTMCFAWFVWYKNYNGEPVIRWL